METIKNDTLVLGGKEFRSRFILGSGKFSLQAETDGLQGSLELAGGSQTRELVDEGPFISSRFGRSRYWDAMIWSVSRSL